MRIVLIANTRSGRGRAVHLADAIAARLDHAGHEVRPATFQDGSPRREAFEGAGAAVVVGGDGSLHAVIDDCVAAGVPVYHAPAGTENLFAREFGMRPDPDRVLAAVEARRTTRIDVGRAGDRAFAIMASIGWDATVIHRLDAVRGGTISHHSYVGPILRQLVRFPNARFTVHADGERVLDAEPGLLIIANSRQYAMRLDPARNARPDDGALDLAFFRFRSRLGLARCSMGALLASRAGLDAPAGIRAARFEVVAEGPGALMQLDGEAVPPAAGPIERAFTIEPGTLGVLLPAERP